MYTYSLVVDRKSYALPAKNLRLVEEMDRVYHIDSVNNMSLRNKFEEILKFIVDTLGEESTKEVLGSVSVDEVDLSMVTITFRMIVDAYNKPITEYNARRNNEMFSSIPSEKIEKVTKLMEAAQNMPND